MKNILTAILLVISITLTGCSFGDFTIIHNNQANNSNTQIGDKVSLALDSDIQIEATLLSAEFCKDIKILAEKTEKWSFTNELTTPIDGEGSMDPRTLNNGSEPVELLLLKQSYENTTENSIELSMLSNKVGGLDPLTHQPIENLTGPRHYCAVYLDVSSEGQQRDSEKGFWIVIIPAGKKIEVTVGYAVSAELIDKEIQYTFSPFGDTDKESAQATVRFTL